MWLVQASAACYNYTRARKRTIRKGDLLMHQTDCDVGRFHHWFSPLLAGVLLVGLLVPSPPTGAPPGESLQVCYEFPAPLVYPAGDYQAVYIPGLPTLNRPGQPRLPIQTARLLIPFGYEVAQVRVEAGQKVVLPGVYRVAPGQEPVPLSHAGPRLPTPPAPETYAPARPFPGALHSPATIQHRRGYRLLFLTLYPVEYTPVTGTLSYYERLTVQVDLRPAPWKGVQMLRQRPTHWAADRAEIQALVDNPAAVATYPTPTQLAQGRPVEVTSALDPATPYDYVIITDENLMAAPGPHNLQALQADKEARGIRTLITTTAWISATYSGLRPDGGHDLQTSIRNFIADAYATWGTAYVLLGGDGDGADVGGQSGDAIIPARGLVVTSTNYSDTNILADMYYGCLDGTFDHNGNGLYGEPDDGPDGGEVDLWAEVYVGRAPVDSATELANWVRKTLAYQTDNDAYLRDVWMVGEYLGYYDETHVWGGDAKDDIIDGSGLAGYTTTVTATIGFENSAYAAFFDTHTLYDRDLDPDRWTKTDMAAVINRPAHIINHLGHTNLVFAMRISILDVPTMLTNTHYFIGYSQGCYVGSFDDRHWDGKYYQYDCIGEHLVNGEHGAVAFVCNSRFGWMETDVHLGASHYYDREFWEAVLGEGIFQLGRANQDSKEDNYAALGPGGFTWDKRWCYYGLNVLGDPALVIRMVGLELSKTGEPDPVPAGGVLTYTLTVSNTGTADATGVIVTDTIPAHTAFRHAENGGAQVNGEVRWTDQIVLAGDSLTLRFSVTVTHPLSPGATIVNTDYGVRCAQGVWTIGDPVTIPLRWYELFLPFVQKP